MLYVTPAVTLARPDHSHTPLSYSLQLHIWSVCFGGERLHVFSPYHMQLLFAVLSSNLAFFTNSLLSHAGAYCIIADLLADVRELFSWTSCWSFRIAHSLSSVSISWCCDLASTFFHIYYTDSESGRQRDSTQREVATKQSLL